MIIPKTKEQKHSLKSFLYNKYLFSDTGSKLIKNFINKFIDKIVIYKDKAEAAFKVASAIFVQRPQYNWAFFVA